MMCLRMCVTQERWPYEHFYEHSYVTFQNTPKAQRKLHKNFIMNILLNKNFD